MTHEPIHTVHLTPHITWQGTQAELEAMKKEGWPLILPLMVDRIKELERNILAAEAKLAKAVEGLESIVDDCHSRWQVPHRYIRDAAQRTLAELKRETVQLGMSQGDKTQ